MAQETLAMKKRDVEKAIGDYVKKRFNELEILGKNKPDYVDRVLATIQDREYFGEGKYNVFLDVYGTEIADNGDLRENTHYTALCSFSVVSDPQGTPMPSLNDSLILSKKPF